MSTLMFLLWAVALAIFFVATGLVSLLPLAGVGALQWWRWQRAQRLNGALRAEVAGIDPRFVHLEDFSIVAVDAARQRLVLGADGQVRHYAFDDVREWVIGEERAPVMVATNPIAAVTLLGAAINADRQAQRNTGLFVRVRDIDHPEWRIAMRRPEHRKRWFEILTQAINEGGSPPGPSAPSPNPPEPR